MADKWNGFHGAARKLEDIDLPRIAHSIGVGEDEVHAILEVESSGSGFDASGRPALLFEPHVFFRNLTGEKRDRAVKAGLAYAKWKPGAYPKDSYPRLLKAMAIDETAALKSGSFGLGQILGENHKAAGYPTVQAMVADCLDDEDNHLEMMIRFIKAKKLDDDLRRHDWAGFARGYNGAGYATHNYHGRLAAAFARWQRIKDTPYAPADVREAAEIEQAQAEAEAAVRVEPEPEPVPVPRPRPVEPAPVDTEVEFVQRRLRELGYYVVGEADGDPAKQTQGAILMFRNEHGLPLSTEIDDALLAALAKAQPRKLPERAAEPEREIATKLEPVQQSALARLWAKVAMIPAILWGAIMGIAEHSDDVMEKLRPIFDVTSAVPLWVYFLAFGGVVLLVLQKTKQAEKATVDLYREGRVM